MYKICLNRLRPANWQSLRFNKFKSITKKIQLQGTEVCNFIAHQKIVSCLWDQKVNYLLIFTMK